MKFVPTISRYAAYTPSSDNVWTGVVRIHDSRISGSAVLLESGIFLLTAAHVTDDLALSSAQVEFMTNGTVITRTVMSVERYPYTVINSLGVWHDIALVTLNQAAPVAAERYSLYTGNTETGNTATLVGYGQAQDIYGTALAAQSAHQRRTAENSVDATGMQLSPFGWRGSLADQLWYDYDDGTASNDALGRLLANSNTGLGESEGMITYGDSGGGLFINQNDQYLLAGINSFITRYSHADTTATPDGSVGDIGVATRVSSYTEWIENQAGLRQTPVPQAGAAPNTDQVPKQVKEGEGVWFLTQLSGVATQITSVDFFTRDGTARAGIDYIPTQGTLTLAPGESWVKLWVQTLADNLLEGNENFSMVLVNPQGAIFPDGAAEITASRTIIDDVTLIGVTKMTPELFA